MDRIKKVIPAQTGEAFKNGLRHPVKWVRGEGIPPENVTPWELLLFLFQKLFGTVAGGFNRVDFLFKDVYRIKANDMSKAGIVSSLWDAFNDPLLGTWMDRKRFGVRAYRVIMRISAITGHVLNMIKMIDGGMDPWMHLTLLVACNCLQDVVGTLDGVAGTKLRAGISPLSQQRARMTVWGNVGVTFGWSLGNLPTMLMGLRTAMKASQTAKISRLGHYLTDYRIIVYGSLVLLPLNVLASILPTFIRQRVQFQRADEPATAPVGEGGSIAEDGERPPAVQESPHLSMRESFAVLKHNPYFIANTVAGFITVFSPTAGDEILLYRWLMPSQKIFGKPVDGEMMLVVKQQFAGILSNVLKPFSRQLINLVGGPLRAQKLNSIFLIVCNLIKFMGGLRTIPGFIVTIITEMLIYGIQDMDTVASDMLNYEFYDKVELETDVRSEGATAAINGFFTKTITNNIGLVTGNAFLQWTGYTGNSSDKTTKPPERYMKWMWPMATLAPAADALVYLVARSFVKWKPEDRLRTEAELAMRHGDLRSVPAAGADNGSE